MSTTTFSVENTVIVLIDHQVGTIGWAGELSSEQEKDEVKMWALLLARFAEGAGMPLVLTSGQQTEQQGPLLPELQDIAAEEYDARIQRVGVVNAWQDPAFAEAVGATGRKNLVMAGVTTDVCLVPPALSARAEGLNIVALTDASAATTRSAGQNSRDLLRGAGIQLMTVVPMHQHARRLHRPRRRRAVRRHGEGGSLRGLRPREPPLNHPLPPRTPHPGPRGPEHTWTVMEIGAYSFGDTPRNPDGSLRSTAEAIHNLFGAIVHADRVGLDYFGIGEHHTHELPASSPGAIVAAAAGATQRITLGSSVAVLSTEDPVRLFQQFATADAVAGGRVEITAGRGSTGESFPLFGYDLSDYDRLYSEKLDLLMAVNASKDGWVRWSGTVRPTLDGQVAVVPRPTEGSLPIWVGTGGSPPSSTRAGQLGLPIAYGIIGGIPSAFGRLADLYRESAARAGHSGPQIKVGVGAWGLVAPTTSEAKERFHTGWLRVNEEMGASRGWRTPTRAEFEAMVTHPGAYYVGDPDSVAERIVDLHRYVGHARHFLQADLGALAHEHFLEHLTLLATEVKPRVDRLLEKK